MREHELRLTVQLMDGLGAVGGVQLHGDSEPANRMPVVSFNIEGLEPSEAAHRLDREFQIMVRAGLHCAPAAHKTLGTFPRGSVRMSPGHDTTEQDIDRAVRAVAAIAAAYQGTG